MKSLLFFIAGMLTTIFVFFIMSSTRPSTEGLAIFSEKKECISKNKFKVFQVLASDMALAIEEDSSGWFINGLKVLIVNKDGHHYYDDEIINIPPGKCAWHIGVFEYSTNDNRVKTVPVIRIE